MGPQSNECGTFHKYFINYIRIKFKGNDRSETY